MAKLLQLIERFDSWWCRNAHQEFYWPIRGVRRCKKCLRETPLPFK